MNGDIPGLLVLSENTSIVESYDTSTGFSLVRKISDKVVNICNHFCEVSSSTIGKREIICGIIIGHIE